MHRPPVLRLAPVFISTLLACGIGHSEPGTESESGDGGSSGEDAAPSTSGPCPADAPANGAACPSSFGGMCEYGTDPDVTCNPTAECIGGHWSNSLGSSMSGSGAACPTPRDATCPSDFIEISNGQPCLQQMTCGYGTGICDCEIPPLPATGSLTWYCNSADSTCPTVRPHLGTVCASEGQTCDYGACTMAEGIGLGCVGGTWQVTDIPCPL